MEIGALPSKEILNYDQVIGAVFAFAEIGFFIVIWNGLGILVLFFSGKYEIFIEQAKEIDRFIDDFYRDHTLTEYTGSNVQYLFSRFILKLGTLHLDHQHIFSSLYPN